VNNTNFPNNGTTNDVGGIISARSKKNTVNDSNMDMLNDTCKENKRIISLAVPMEEGSWKKKTLI
jgi:hypothetical protein